MRTHKTLQVTIHKTNIHKTHTAGLNNTMRFSSTFFSSMAIASAAAFSLQPINRFSTQQRHEGVSLSAQLSEDENPSDWKDQFGKMLVTGLVSASLWASPAAIQESAFGGTEGPQIFQSSVANAKQMASASGSRVNKDPESLLRYGLPINSKEVCDMRAPNWFAYIGVKTSNTFLLFK